MPRALVSEVENRTAFHEWQKITVLVETGSPVMIVTCGSGVISIE